MLTDLSHNIEELKNQILMKYYFSSSNVPIQRTSNPYSLSIESSERPSTHPDIDTILNDISNTTSQSSSSTGLTIEIAAENISSNHFSHLSTFKSQYEDLTRQNLKLMPSGTVFHYPGLKIISTLYQSIKR